MAAFSTIIAAGALGVAGAGAYQANKNAKKAARANEQAAALDRQRMNLQSARERREAVRASRLAYANAQVAATNQGVGGSSGASGGQGSIVSQLSSNLSFLDRFNTLSDQASMQIGYANKFTQKAQTWNSVSNLAWSVFSNANTIANMAGANSGE